MGTSLRHILVDQDDAVIRLSNVLFERLWDNSHGDKLPQFAGCRVRYAEAAVELQNRRPVHILRLVFSYLHFDDRGRLDKDKVMKSAALMVEAGIGGIAPPKSGSVIHAAPRFIARRRDHEAIWKPNPVLHEKICDAALDSKSYQRL
ncbi:MAG: hypothetical protein ACM3TN_11245 [Alphaproteobacteria bacterium]